MVSLSFWGAGMSDAIFMSSDIIKLLCSVHIHVNNYSKSTRPRHMLFILKDTISFKDENMLQACRFMCSSVPQSS